MSPAKNSLRLVLLLGSLTAFAPLAIDMYLPAFPEIALEFGVGIGRVQQSLAIFLLGLALGQLFYGPMADRLGRRRPLVLGCLMFAASALGCLWARSIEGLIFWRFLMGLGGSAGVVIVRAVVRDLYDERGSARMYASMMLVTSVAPLVAPSLGGQLMRFSTWHLIFVIQAVFGLACAVVVAFRLPESLAPEKRLRGSFMEVGKGYGRMLMEKRFVGYTLSVSCASCMLFSYVSGSSFVFRELYGISAQHYGFYFSSIAAALFGTAQLNRLLFRRFTPRRILQGAFAANAVLTLMILGSVWSGKGGFPVLYSLLFLSLATLGLIFPNATALCMGPYGREAGSASALLGTSQYTLGALGGALVGYFHNGTALPMAGLIAVSSWAGLAILVAIYRSE